MSESKTIAQKVNDLSSSFLDKILPHSSLRNRPILTLSSIAAALLLINSWLLYAFPSSVSLNPFSANIIGNPSLIVLEPENGSLSSPMSVGSDTTASNNKYISSNVSSLAAPTTTTAATSACAFRKATAPVQVAMCDSFDQPAGTGTRSGDLASIWGVSRVSDNENIGQGNWDTWLPTKAQLCNPGVSLLAPKDVQICNGQLVEAVQDGGDALGHTTILGIYPKKPFDISNGRTGDIVFDLGSTSQGSHAAWAGFALTDQPIPAPGIENDPPGINDTARNAIGFAITSAGSNVPPICQEIQSMFITRNYVSSDIPFTSTGCVNPPVPTNSGPLNHFEILISTSHMEVWGSDAGSTTMKQLAVANNINLPFTKGLAWMTDSHYNACKFDQQCDNSFRWDNFGFDGPSTAQDIATDVPDNGAPITDGSFKGEQLGWVAPGDGTTLTLHTLNVTNVAQASAGLITLNYFQNDGPSTLSYRLNGKTWHTQASLPTNSMGVPVPLSEMQDGVNTIELKSSAANGAVVANVDLIAVGAGNAQPVGGSTTTVNLSGSSAMTFNAPTAGTYAIWSRIQAADTNSDSFWMQVDNQSPIKVGDGGVPFNQWSWINYQNGDANQHITASLTAGSHTITVYGREAGTKLDALVLTQDLTFNPNTPEIVDGTAPVVTISSPSNNATLSATATVLLQATDDHSVAKVDLLLDNNIVSTKTSPDSGLGSNYTFSLDTTKFTQGTHTLSAKATDIAGNVGSSSVLSVSISQPAPTPTPSPTPTPTPSPSPSPTPAPSPSPTPSPSPAPAPKPIGDLNGDGKVNVRDISILLRNWGKHGGPADLNHDGIVNVIDLQILLSNWTG